VQDCAVTKKRQESEQRIEKTEKRFSEKRTKASHTPPLSRIVCYSFFVNPEFLDKNIETALYFFTKYFFIRKNQGFRDLRDF